jgi:hypothetical protein
MGYRLSGGMIYKLTEPLMGINDMKMMVRLALGGECITKEEINHIDICCNSRAGAQLMIPLEPGTIARIEGLEEVLKIPTITDFIQYYYVGDTIENEYIGTLQQHFGRFSLIANSEDEIQKAVSIIQNLLVIIDTKGNRQNRMLFDMNRVTQ